MHDNLISHLCMYYYYEVIVGGVFEGGLGKWNLYVGFDIVGRV